MFAEIPKPHAEDFVRASLIHCLCDAGGQDSVLRQISRMPRPIDTAAAISLISEAIWWLDVHGLVSGLTVELGSYPRAPESLHAIITVIPLSGNTVRYIFMCEPRRGE